MNTPKRYNYGGGTAPKADNRIRIKGSTDYIMLLCVVLLVAIGIVMVFSSSYYTAGRGKSGDIYLYLKKELGMAAGGFIIMFICTQIPYKKIKRFTKPLYAVANILLVLVLFFGTEAGGAKRWLWGFQPSEVAKVAVIVTLSTVITNFPEIFDTWKGVGTYLVILGIPTGLVAIENLSTAIVLGVVGCSLFFVSTPKLTKLVPVGALGVAGVLAMTFGTGFRSNRVQAWLDPFSDSSNTGYQVVQSLYAIASGGMFGLGIGGSRQKLGYMPEAHNDIIFAIICEELGWFGAAIVVILFAILIWRGIIVAIKHKDDMFAMLMATGITVMIAVQVIINIAVVTNSMPNTGIPLPFISYGGTSLIIMMGCVGILMNISRYDKITEEEYERKNKKSS